MFKNNFEILEYIGSYKTEVEAVSALKEVIAHAL